MPKEVIHDDTALPGTDQSSDRAVEVAWGRDTWVQMGTINLQNEPATEQFGWFVSLDRGMINKVIRVLRRARDQAYGADE